jgi:hypothetical protein
VEFVDIYPTVMELAKHRLAGRSLVPLLKDPLAKWDGHARLPRFFVLPTNNSPTR